VSAVKVPDGAIDPFKLILENAKDAESHGAKFFLHTEVASLRIGGDRIRSVEAKDLATGEELSMEASFFINATGAWANRVLRLAGLHIGIALSKGSLLITNRRFTHRVINHCRPPRMETLSSQ